MCVCVCVCVCMCVLEWSDALTTSNANSILINLTFDKQIFNSCEIFCYSEFAKSIVDRRELFANTEICILKDILKIITSIYPNEFPRLNDHITIQTVSTSSKYDFVYAKNPQTP